MSSDLVNLTVDGRGIAVPKGLGLVEVAAAAGVEIPVFCYEPRLGPPVGACRMCLVEVEGMPKLQAGCTLSAQDGMVVKTARSSVQAAGGQNNHPILRRKRAACLQLRHAFHFDEIGRAHA